MPFHASSGTSRPPGAAIEVRTPLWFPDHFTLGVASDGTRRACHIVWRGEQRIGLTFD
jgi:hypothetical protein